MIYSTKYNNLLEVVVFNGADLSLSTTVTALKCSQNMLVIALVVSGHGVLYTDSLKTSPTGCICT